MSDVTKTIRDISELKEVAQTACKLFLDECKKGGLDIFITETYRSQERQNYLYEQGRTRAGKKVTWTKNSRHTSRLAWDIACNKPSLYDVATIKKAGSIAKRLNITWGGDWKTPDMPHFEITTSWKAPKGYIAKVEEKESVRMFVPTSSTNNNEFIEILEEALKDKIITDKSWLTKAKAGQLKESDATVITAIINDRRFKVLYELLNKGK